jgi:acyl dehydratase
VTAARRTTTRRLSQVAVGEALPPLEVPITATAIIAGALASRDYQDVHHDRDLAVARGAKDIFMNILTTNGYVGRYATDWAGPEARLRAVDIRLGVPNHPGDTMTLTGRVASKEGGLVRLEIVGANRLGDHVTGTVTLTLPD